MTTQQALDREPTPAPRAMALNRLQAVGTTGGRKAAAWPDHRRDETPVEPDQRQHQERHGAVEAAT